MINVGAVLLQILIWIHSMQFGDHHLFLQEKWFIVRRSKPDLNEFMLLLYVQYIQNTKMFTRHDMTSFNKNVPFGIWYFRNSCLDWQLFLCFTFYWVFYIMSNNRLFCIRSMTHFLISNIFNALKWKWISDYLDISIDFSRINNMLKTY